MRRARGAPIAMRLDCFGSVECDSSRSFPADILLCRSRAANGSRQVGTAMMVHLVLGSPFLWAHLRHEFLLPLADLRGREIFLVRRHRPAMPERVLKLPIPVRSEERRVGKEGRSRWS